MPLSKSLSKINKNLRNRKKATGKAITIHPNGRKFRQINRATLREEKITRQKKEFNERRSAELMRVKSVQDVINSEAYKARETFSLEDVVEFTRAFVERDDPEIDELKAKRRANRPPTNRQQVLENKRAAEMEEFQKGFLIPDLTAASNVEFLRNWNGSFGSMSTLKMIRVNAQAELAL